MPASDKLPSYPDLAGKVAVVDGGPMRDMVIRVTHIYGRIDGDWKLVHRHADFPPPDQRTISAR